MSIAEKTITISANNETIAENEQKVYIAGQNLGYSNGYEEGHNNGYTDGYETGTYQGVEIGKKDEYDRFWDNYQNCGNRKGYQTAFFGEGWTDEIYNPKYPVTVHNSAGSMYAQSLITDTKVPIIFKSTAYSLAGLFQSCSYIKYIRSLDISEYQYTYTNWFAGNSALLSIDAIIGNFKSDVSFQWSTKLETETAIRILTHLENYKGTEYENTYTIKLPNNIWNNVEAYSSAPNGGTWKDYITDVLGWKY